jgi:hypothetical protein
VAVRKKRPRPRPYSVTLGRYEYIMPVHELIDASTERPVKLTPEERCILDELCASLKLSYAPGDPSNPLLGDARVRALFARLEVELG